MRCTSIFTVICGVVVAGPLFVLVCALPVWAQDAVSQGRDSSSGRPTLLNGTLDTDDGSGAPVGSSSNIGQTSNTVFPASSTGRAGDRGRAGRITGVAVSPTPRRDGDLLPRSDLIAPVDGVIDLSTQQAVLDGLDPALNDARSNEDRAVFETPPSGYNPLLFQIEDVQPADPRINRRPRRLFTREPYDPVGVRIGSFVLFPEVETGLNWSSNVFASPSAQADRSYRLRPSARLVSNWRNHAVELRGSADLSTHDEFKTEDARGYLLEARGRLDVTRRMNLQAVIGRQVSQESRSAVDANTVGDRPDITTDSASLALTRRFNRLTVQLRGAVTGAEYGEVDGTGDFAAVTPGAESTQSVITRGTITNNDRNFIETREAVRVSWEFKPTLRVFGEAELVQRDFDVAATSDNISRDSQGGRYRVGVDFGSTSDILRGEISMGYGDHRPNDSRLSDIDGLIVDANLAWRFNGLTSLLFTASSGVSDTTTARSGGVFDRQGGVAVRHAFREHLIGTAGATYTRRDISGVDIDESDVQLNVGVDYFLNPSVVLFGTYGHTISRSGFVNSDYNLDEVYVGVRVRR